MTTARALARPIARPVARLINQDVSGIWSPAALQNLIQRFLDGASTDYYSSLVNSYPVLTPQESGTVALPRKGRCALFDGVDDCARASSAVTLTGALTLSFWMERTSTATGVTMVGNSVSFSNLVWIDDNTHIYVSNNVGNTPGNGATFEVPSMAINTAYHVVVTRNSSNEMRLYFNGTESTTGAVTVPDSIVWDQLGCRADAVSHFPGRLWDVRIYNVAKSATEAAAIYNQHLTPTTIDTSGLQAAWWLSEEAGTTHYDWIGNRNLTIGNATLSTYHATNTRVKYSAANHLGHTISGSTVIPRDESDTSKDASGSAIGVSGPVAYPAIMEVPCLTYDGTDDRLAMGTAIDQTNCTICLWFKSSAITDDNMLLSEYSVGTEYINTSSATTITVSTGGTGATGVSFTVPTMANDTWYHLAVTKSGTSYRVYLNGTESSSGAQTAGTRLKLDAIGSHPTASYTWNGSICDVRAFSVAKSAAEVLAIKQGTDDSTGLLAHWPLQDGPGATNTNTTAYDISGNANHATLTNFTIASAWANRCPYVKDRCILEGGRLASGVFIASVLGGSLAANGAAKNLTAGKHGNPYSRVVPNSWDAPALVNIGSTSSDKYAPAADVQSETTADTRFRRTASDGDDRYFATREALTGSTKTLAEAYVS